MHSASLVAKLWRHTCQPHLLHSVVVVGQPRLQSFRDTLDRNWRMAGFIVKLAIHRLDYPDTKDIDALLDILTLATRLQDVRFVGMTWGAPAAAGSQTPRPRLDSSRALGCLMFDQVTFTPELHFLSQFLSEISVVQTVALNNCRFNNIVGIGTGVTLHGKPRVEELCLLSSLDVPVALGIQAAMLSRGSPKALTYHFAQLFSSQEQTSAVFAICRQFSTSIESISLINACESALFHLFCTSSLTFGG